MQKEKMERTADIERTIEILLEKEIDSDLFLCEKQGKAVFEHLGGDGSSRQFIRVSGGMGPVCIAVLPPSSGKRDMAEFRAALEIGRHLDSVGASVPKILAADERIGLILFEDFGDVRLHDILNSDRQQGLALYRRVVKELVHLQVKGASGFDQNWCYDTTSYDTDVMLNREAGYFLKAFWQDTIHGEAVEGLAEEFADIAAQVMNYSEPFFLHRDFQSRNIMICNGRIGIIDFQAARFGPPGYDLASLLIDPYVTLSHREQQELFSLYIEEIKLFPDVSLDYIVRSYPFLALQRNVQIIGAFAYLSGKMEKPFFRPYILPSLIMLENRLQEEVFQPYGILQETVAEAITMYCRYVR